MADRKGYYRLTSHTWQLRVDKPDGFFRGQPPRETVYRRNQSPQDIAWLGKLALLHLGDGWWERPDGLHFFSQMVEEHNQLFSFY